MAYVSNDVLLDFVAHSNRIEGEPDEPGHPLFDHHLRIARVVARESSEFVWRPRDIHEVLLRSQPQKYPGEYRQCRVTVGGHEKILPFEVRSAMASLMGYLSLYNGMTEEDCWRAHHEFERIHPFVDGNGRTGRLWLNALRLAVGYEWLTVRFEKRFEYYEAIRAYEQEREG